MINLSAADDFLKELGEKNKNLEKTEIERAIRILEQTLDKFEDDFNRTKDRVKKAGIGDNEFTKIKKEIKDKVEHILMIY